MINELTAQHSGVSALMGRRNPCEWLWIAKDFFLQCMQCSGPYHLNPGQSVIAHPDDGKEQ